MRSSIFTLDMPLDEEIVFHKWEFSPTEHQLPVVTAEEAGPRVTLITGIHGDEVNGPYIAWKLIRRFTEHPEDIVNGLVRIIPAANPFGLHLSSHAWPFDQMDINSMFPGYLAGETTQRIAAHLFHEVSSSDFCINIHSGTHNLFELPQVRLYESCHNHESAARNFGLPLVWLRKATHPLDKTLFASQVGRAGIATFTIHAGQAQRVDVFAAEDTYSGILRFLAGIGVIRAVAPDPTSMPSLVVTSEQIIDVVSPDAGLFMTEQETGINIRKGDVVGSLVDPCVGGPPVIVKSPVDGLLITLKVHPVTYEGDLLARIATRQ